MEAIVINQQIWLRVCADGAALYRAFLLREFSNENLEFWLACEEYKNSKPQKLSARAQKIYNDFVAVQATKEVRFSQILAYYSTFPCAFPSFPDEIDNFPVVLDWFKDTWWPQRLTHSPPICFVAVP